MNKKLKLLTKSSILCSFCMASSFWVNGQSTCEIDSSSFVWSTGSWENGDNRTKYRVNSGHPADSIDIDISVDAKSSGSFADFDVLSPYIDGDTATWNFGSEMDLGIIFHPDQNQGTSPIEIAVTFGRPVSCVEFEISDIDVWGSIRRDSLVVLGNGGSLFPALTVMSDTPTVQVNGNIASALGAPNGPAGNGSAYSNSDAGTIHVDFGSELIDSVTILYYEASGSSNPGGRGIGVLGDFSFSAIMLLPVELLSFEVGQNESCQPILRWYTANEYGLDHYAIEYSYDGFNFQEAAKVKARNSYIRPTEYIYTLDRKLNSENYLRLVKIQEDGKQDIIGLESLDGKECQALASVNVYPNPSFKNYFYVAIESKAKKDIQIWLINQNGKKVLQTSYHLKSGNNWFSISSKYLTPGVYHLNFDFEGETISRKISIMG